MSLFGAGLRSSQVVCFQIPFHVLGCFVLVVFSLLLKTFALHREGHKDVSLGKVQNVQKTLARDRGDELAQLQHNPLVYHFSLKSYGSVLPTIIICDENVCRALPPGGAYFCDATFSLIKGKHQVLAILSFDAAGRSCPILYAIMTGRTAADYRVVFGALQNAGV